MRKVIALFLSLCGLGFATLPSCTKPIPSIDTALVPKVVYVDQNDDEAYDCINEQGDTLRAMLTALGGSTGSVGLSSVGDIKATIDRDSNTTGARFWVANHTNDTLMRVADDSTFKIFGALTIGSLTGTGTRLVTATAAGAVGNATSVSGAYTWADAQTFTASPVQSALTASLPVFTNGSKALASNAMTGTGSVMMSASPTTTGTLTAANGTYSGTLTSTGLLTASSGLLLGTGTGAAGKIYTTATAGSVIWGAAGSSYDFLLANSAGSTVMTVPTGTTAVTLAGAVTGNSSGSGTSSAFTASSAAPTYTWVATGGAADTKNWDATAGATTLAFRTRTDANGSGQDWLTVTRSGTTVSDISFSRPVTATADLHATGTTGPSAAGSWLTGEHLYLNRSSGTGGVIWQNGSAVDQWSLRRGTPSAGNLTLDAQSGTGASGLFRIKNSSGGSEVFSVDTQNGRVGIGNAAPTVPLDVTGAALISSTLGATGLITATAGVSVPDGAGVVTTISASTRTLAARSGTTLNLGENGGWTGANYRLASGTHDFTIGGASVFSATSTGVTVPGITTATGGLTLGARFIDKTTTVTSGTTTLGTTQSVIFADATSGNVTLNLPAVSGNAGLTYKVYKTDAATNTVTLDGNASETIDGALTAVLGGNLGKSLIVVICTGSAWRIATIQDVGDFTATHTGLTITNTSTGRYTRDGYIVHLQISPAEGTSNTIAYTITGLPSQIYPATGQVCPATAIADGSNKYSGALAINTSGVIDVYFKTTATADVSNTYTNSGTKGLHMAFTGSYTLQ